MFKNTFQSGFLSILYSLGYVVGWPSDGLIALVLSFLSLDTLCLVFSPLLFGQDQATADMGQGR